MTQSATADKQVRDLTPEECQTLLSQHHLGRVAYLDTAGVMPAILPVNYIRLGKDVVFGTDPGSKLRAALHNTPVAFEVDGVDQQLEIGWSVLIRGFLSEVTDRAELDELRRSPLRAWAPGAKAHFLRVSPRQITGSKSAYRRCRRTGGADSTFTRASRLIATRSDTKDQARWLGAVTVSLTRWFRRPGWRSC
jgi:nitroimidazol reductase NimA-like FMN-containing flavoprotein (pyridoxamine 5'-phosphate oxidase superfamily)